MISAILSFAFIVQISDSLIFQPQINVLSQHRSIPNLAMGNILQPTMMPMADEKDTEKYGWDLIKDALSGDDDKDPKKKPQGPPIYEPESYPIHAVAALAYVVPLLDAFDLGKYIFEAYPDVLGAYNAVLGPLASIYNGVPFLPFAVFFLMSYISRAPTFPVEVRFHYAQALMLCFVQFVPSLGLSLLEKAGVAGLGVLYNTAFLWVTLSCVIMQALLLNPLSEARNPFLLNVVSWALRYMNYTPDLVPKR